MKTSTKQICMWTPLILLYIYVIGPFMFMFLEGGLYDKNDKVNVSALKSSLSLELNLSRTDVERVFEKLAENNLLKFAHSKEFDPWNYASCVTYSWTLISTVGWGYIAPITFGGRLFTIFYSLFGIPLYALFLRWAGIWIKELLASGLKKFELCIMGNDNAQRLHVKSSILLLLLVILVLMSGAELFSRRNGWSRFEGFYFCFITLSTIGLGDLYYVFNQNVESPEAIIIDSFGCLIFIWGLILVSTFLCQMSETLDELQCNGKQSVNPFEFNEEFTGCESSNNINGTKSVTTNKIDSWRRKRYVEHENYKRTEQNTNNKVRMDEQHCSCCNKLRNQDILPRETSVEEEVDSLYEVKFSKSHLGEPTKRKDVFKHYHSDHSICNGNTLAVLNKQNGNQPKVNEHSRNSNSEPVLSSQKTKNR